MIRETPGADGIWIEQLTPTPLARRPGLFLDRDGVLVAEVGYLHRPEEVTVLPGAVDLLRFAVAAQWALVLVTNQSGIGRGLYGWADFAQTQARMMALLAAKGVQLDLVLACPFHPAGQGHFQHAQHPFRKPAPAMLLTAAALLNIDLADSWIVGDQITDLQAGKAAGLKGGILVTTGHGADHSAAAQALCQDSYLTKVVADAGAAAVFFRSITKNAAANR